MFNTSLNNGSNEKTGTIKAWGGSAAPFGWLICDGSAISRTLYAALFDVIGETYGAGDGTTTFNLPNGKAVIGNQAPALGSGKALGITDGTNNNGLTQNVQSGYWGYAGFSATGYGADNGTVVTPSDFSSGYKVLGITIDSAKSGIIVDLTLATAASLAIIKY